MVASWSAHMFLPHLKRKARAIMDMRQWLKFSSEVASCRDATRADVVAIHQHVLKSTTSAGAVRDLRDMRERRDSKLRVRSSENLEPYSAHLSRCEFQVPVEKLLWHGESVRVCTSRTAREPYAGCSKRPSSEAAGESKPEAYPRGTLRLSMNRERSWRSFSASC